MNDDPELTKRIEVAHYIASTADSMITDLFHKSLKVEDKLVDGLITELDQTIQAMAINNIHATFGQDGFSSDHTALIKSNSGYEWLVDPIAGTNNFVRGLPLCGFQLAISHDGELVYSLIHRPFTQEWFIAQKGQGATYANHQTGETAPLKVSDRTLPDAMAIFDASVGKSDNPATQILGSLANEIAAVRTFGVAVFDIPAVASGVAEAFITGIANQYYISAGKLLVEEAGGEVYDLKGNPVKLTDKFMIFSSKSLKEPLLKAIKSAL